MGDAATSRRDAFLLGHSKPSATVLAWSPASVVPGTAGTHVTQPATGRRGVVVGTEAGQPLPAGHTRVQFSDGQTQVVPFTVLNYSDLEVTGRFPVAVISWLFVSGLL